MKLKELEAEMANCPPGTRRMPENERVEMLEQLQSVKKELEAEAMRFPISMKTIAIQKRKEGVEAQLEKVENSIKTFSKEIVYIGI